MSEAKTHDKEASSALSEKNNFFSVICGLVNLSRRLSASAASLVDTSALSSRSPIDLTDTTSLVCSTLTRWCDFSSSWPLMGKMSLVGLRPLLAYLWPSTTGFRHPKHGFFGLVLTWWIWRYSIAWILTRAILFLLLLYFTRCGGEAGSLKMKYTTILILGAGVIGSTVVNSSVLLGSLGWVVGCGTLARVYVASSRISSWGKAEAPQL
ncbi:hypothetical protein FOCG_18431 [Fusarium oxysporum f. sp. radicis-lycopersici 26381]|nr:hypothetical protein FOCG_18431 [Fusarium oxysporum f. sp. radicis-lycopersici 26381]